LSYDPWEIAEEIREQLASEKRKIAFFFGAGTSMAVGLPGIDLLTEKIASELKEAEKTSYESVKSHLPEKVNIELILDRIRIIRELIGDSEEREIDGLKGKKNAANLDSRICELISKIIKEAKIPEDKPHNIFAQWLWLLHNKRYYPAEIFTANYDLLFEISMEAYGVPFFDGFIGAVNPFFAPESVEADKGSIHEDVLPPRAWTRLWKMHGSINWHIHENKKITRFLNGHSKGELVIFPSREKYSESRKLPFIAFQDRFRRVLTIGECLLIVVGYSFSDEHINDILFQSLRSNPRLSASSFLFGEEVVEGKRTIPDKILKYGIEHRNLSILGPDQACIGGIIEKWSSPSRAPKEDQKWVFWDSTQKIFTLGDFNLFASFLEKIYWSSFLP